MKNKKNQKEEYIEKEYQTLEEFKIGYIFKKRRKKLF
jgi:hypothetical protein